MSFKSLVGIDEKKFFQTILIGFILVEILSWIVSYFAPSIPMLKGGWILFLFLIVIFLSTLYNLGMKITELNFKRDIILFVLVFAIITLLWVVLPSIVPQIFSTTGMDLRDFLRNTVQSAIKLGPSGIAG